MSVPGKPSITRLRWVSSKDAKIIQLFTRKIEQRIQIYSINFARGKWVMWFTPGDIEKDIQSGDLD